MLISLALPLTIFISDWNWNFLWVGAFLSLISYSLIKISYLTLLSTNNPADRKNMFSINKRYSSRLNDSISEKGMNAIILQEPTIQEKMIFKRKVRLKKLIKINNL